MHLYSDWAFLKGIIYLSWQEILTLSKHFDNVVGKVKASVDKLAERL